MKSLSLKVMTLLMVALVLSAGGCSNENEMSSPEGAVKGYLKAINKAKKRILITFELTFSTLGKVLADSKQVRM